MLRDSIRGLAVVVGGVFMLGPAPARYLHARAVGCPTDGGRQYVPIVKILFAVTLAGMMVSTAVHAGCMQDRWGHVVCGAGSCVRDREGMVYCAPTRFGSVVRTIDGQVKCAPGQCVKTLEGELICSSVDGGGAVKLVDGTVRCEGSCEHATTDLCEALPAGR